MTDREREHDGQDRGRSSIDMVVVVVFFGWYE
jgi:hypothetical protein